jgi:hypothetical protein
MNPKKSNNWKWFFAALVVLSLLASGTLIGYNMQLQLRPEELEAKRELWRQNRPASYTLIYTETFSSQADSAPLSNHYVVKVDNRKVREVLVNGIPKKEGLEYHDMDGLFNEVERFFELDEKEKRRVFRKAQFDDNGAIKSYVRRVAVSRERQEILVESLQAR